MDEGGVGGEMAVALMDFGEVGQLDPDHRRRGAVALGEADDPLELGAEAAGAGQRRDMVALGVALEVADALLGLGERGAEQGVLVGGLDGQAGEIGSVLGHERPCSAVRLSKNEALASPPAAG